MSRTKLFKNGNSQAVRIPAELAYNSWDLGPVIERRSDELRIRPARRRMGDLLGTLARFSPDFMAECFVGDVLISAITHAELAFGVACSGDSRAQNEKALSSLLQDIPVAPFDADAARPYGPLRAANRDRSKDALDKLIASHAVALGVTLATHNEADFRCHGSLPVGNWVNSH